MNKIFTLSFFCFTLFSVSAQNNYTDTVLDSVTGKKKLAYNTWSIEANIGSNKAVRPFSPGFAVSGDSRFINITGINHFDIGVRKMLNTKFGFKFDLASDVIESQDNVADSKSFQSFQNRIALQGIINLTRVLNFNLFSGRFGLLAHGGPQVSRLTPRPPTGKRARPELNGGYMLGLTPQFRITDKLVFTSDFTVLVNSRQHYTWDGGENKISNNLSGEMNVISFGLTVYLGNKDKHSDWFISKPKPDPSVLKSLAELQLLTKDIDVDGVPDHIDLQNDTPKNLVVDSRGRFIDLNTNNIPDEQEPKVETVKTEVVKNIEKPINPIDIKTEFGLVDIYYDVNKVLPVALSTNVLNNLVVFLKKYPETKIALTGYADATGNIKANIELANKRAENLKKYIISNGIDANRLSTNGNGVDKSSNVNDPGSLQLARRVSVTLQ